MLRTLTKELFKILVLIFLAIIVLFPLYFLLLVALKNDIDLQNNIITILIKNPTSSNFKQVINSGFLQALSLTLLAVLFLICLRIIVYSLAIAGLIKLKKKSIQNAVIYVLLVLSIIPEFILYSALKLNLNNWKWADKYWISLTFNGIFSFFIFTYTFKVALNISNTKGRLAINDNLKWYEKVIYVYLPDLKLSYLLLIIFTTIQVWNDYLWPLYLLRNNPIQNISQWFSFPKVTEYRANVQNLIAAGSFIASIIPLSIYLIFSKWINRSTR